MIGVIVVLSLTSQKTPDREQDVVDLQDDTSFGKQVREARTLTSDDALQITKHDRFSERLGVRVEGAGTTRYINSYYGFSLTIPNGVVLIDEADRQFGVLFRQQQAKSRD